MANRMLTKGSAKVHTDSHDDEHTMTIPATILETLVEDGGRFGILIKRHNLGCAGIDNFVAKLTWGTFGERSWKSMKPEMPDKRTMDMMFAFSIEAMATEGYITKSEHADGKRLVIGITDKGRKRLAEILGRLDDGAAWDFQSELLVREGTRKGFLREVSNGVYTTKKLHDVAYMLHK